MSNPYGKVVCKHCGEFRTEHGRGLCKRCYQKNDVRKLYPPQRASNYNAASLPLPDRWPQPTSARPGTEAKVEELARRAEAGEYLWHPRDARGE